MTKKAQFLKLLERYREGSLTPEEKRLLDAWYNVYGTESTHELAPDELANVEADLQRRLPLVPPAHVKPLWQRIAAAASVIVFLSAGAYFLLHEKPTPQEALAKQDIAPFTQQAILKTGHGKTIRLNDHKGIVAQYANTEIKKTGGDQITYTNNANSDNKIIFDTLQIPAGGKPYHLKLADGSTIIVNVASSIRFPENFRVNNNEVNLMSGEAYFSIVHNSKAPLLIKAKGQLIEDIGTEFNVNTYVDEPDSKTTLIDGAIRVNSRSLLPGQQAIVTSNKLTVATADIIRVTAWKEGYFRFNNEEITTIMRELARWYNIEVAYEQPVTWEHFTMKISRAKNISLVLQILEQTQHVHFKINGRRVTVLHK
jgi:transmembrane sensor